MEAANKRTNAMVATTTAPRSRSDAPLHLVFVPFLSRSHFAPVAAQAAAAASRGDGATILTTPHFVALAPSSVPVHVASFTFPGGHEDFSLLPDDASAPAFFSAVKAALAPALAAAVRAHNGAVAIVSDAVLHWVPHVASDCGVPHVTFHTIGAFAAATMVAVHLHGPEVLAEPVAVPGGFPRPVKLLNVHVNEEALAHLPLFRSAEAESYAVVFNSFSALEADFAGYYGSLDGSPKVFLVGPRRAATAASSDGTVTGDAERDPILQWLDSQVVSSVVYACFGSTCGLGANQLLELATGLRASGRPFLWVIPAPAEGMERQEERASSHGMVVVGRWAPQAEILAHPAVGGFVSHCGWNSVLDAVCAGVPLATWPLRAEQFLNEAFIVDVLRVGVRVREVTGNDDLEAVVPSDAVARAVSRLMDGGEDEATGWRARVRELGVAGRAALAVGGSSCLDWARLVDELTALHCHDNVAVTTDK